MIQLYIIASVCLLICRTPIINRIKWYLFQGQETWLRKVLKTKDPWFVIRLKPFDCCLCLTFWVSLWINCYLYSVPESFGISAINALIASELEKYLKK